MARAEPRVLAPRRATREASGTRRGRRAFRVLPILLPLLVLVVTGVRGLDFGLHWDERHYQIGPVETMVATGRLLPGYYGYPSFNYWVSSAALLPEAVAAAVRGSSIREHLLATIATRDYLLRLRAVFLLLSALAVVWVYLAVSSWRRSVPEATLAASFLALSWEVAYHARWIATDGVLMQFGALTILLVILSQVRPEGRRWLYPAAVAAGLGAGTKYPGGLLLVPVLTAGVVLGGSPPRLREAVRGTAALCAVAIAAFLLSTPAALLDTTAMIDGIRYEISHYGGGHAGHTVRRGPDHLLRMADYLGLALFSWYTPLAATVSVFATLGLLSLRRQPRMAFLLLSFPALYLMYFATQKAMIVRNLLVVAPFLAILAARGAAWAWQRLESSAAGYPRLALLRHLLVASLLALLLINAAWLWSTAATIRQRHSADFAAAAIRHVAERPASTYYLSPRVHAHFAVLDPRGHPNVVSDPSTADHVLFYAHEAMHRWEDWPANRRRLTERWFGPYEVNFNVYPNWWGDDRIVLMRSADAAAIGVLVPAEARR